MRIAIPVTNGRLAMHFGHCQEFALVDVETDGDNKGIQKVTMVPAPEHQPGLLPPWLHEQAADIIIAGGMGSRAHDLFVQQGMEVIVGAPSMEPQGIERASLASELERGQKVCDH